MEITNAQIKILKVKAIKLVNQGKTDKASMIYEDLIRNGIESALIYSNLASLKRYKNKKQAIELLKRSIILEPEYCSAYYNLANIYIDLEQHNKAIVCLKQAITIDNKFIAAYMNLGMIYLLANDLYTAIENFNRIIQIDSNNYDAYINLGNAYKGLGELDKAIGLYEKVMKFNPQKLEAFVNYSLTQLLKGNYLLGWKYFDLRSQGKQPIKPHVMPIIKHYESKTLLNRSRLLVVSEQGLGDTLQFMRYIKFLKEKKFKVTFCAQRCLHKLIRSSNIDKKPIDIEEAKLITKGEWISLLSLPSYLGVTPQKPLMYQPYIKANPKLIEKWNNLLNQEKRPIIGINWQGNPNVEKSTLKGRSFQLEKFAKIIDKNNITLLSLQKGYGLEQMSTCSFSNRFINEQDKINEIIDFDETAAIIANCNLIITSDTCVAHLAGGMGKPVWLLIQYIPYWTWGMNKSTTFWYPSMRLFRQKKINDWDEVMERVSKALEHTISF